MRETGVRNLFVLVKQPVDPLQVMIAYKKVMLKLYKVFHRDLC